MSEEPIKLNSVDTPKGVIGECSFCGDRYAGNQSGKCALYCKNCKTKTGREKIWEENKAIFKAQGLEYKQQLW